MARRMPLGGLSATWELSEVRAEPGCFLVDRMFRIVIAVTRIRAAVKRAHTARTENKSDITGISNSCVAVDLLMGEAC